MKTLKTMIAAMAILISMNVSGQTVFNPKKPSNSTYEQNSSKTQAHDGGVSLPSMMDGTFTLPPVQTSFMDYVKAVRPFYSNGDTFEQFKLKVLVGNETVTSRTALPVLPETEVRRLRKAFDYLSKESSTTNAY